MTLEQQRIMTATYTPLAIAAQSAVTRAYNQAHLQIVAQQVHVITCLLFPFFSVGEPFDFVSFDESGYDISCQTFLERMKAMIKHDVGPIISEIVTHLKTITEDIQSFGAFSDYAFTALDNRENVEMLVCLTQYLQQVNCQDPQV